MEKIIQLPLRLPPVSPDVLRRVALEAVEVALEQAGVELSGAEVGEFVSAFDRAVVPRITTPRLGKRYGNAVLFALPMIGDEVRPLDLLLIEAMRIFYPQLYDWVRTHEDDVIAHRSTAHGLAEAAIAVVRSAVTNAAAGMTETDTRGAQILLTTLFPRTESVWQNKGWGTDWDPVWAKQKRIASKEYFRRYFTYTVPAGDVRDADVDSLITMLGDPTSEEGAVAELAGKLLNDGGPDTFLQKLGTHADGFTALAAKRLTILLAAFSDLLPDESGFLGRSTLERAALLASKLIERVPAVNRSELVSAVMKAAPRIPFGVELLRWLGPRTGEANGLSIDETAEAGRELVERIVAVWDGDDPFAVLGKRVAGTLHVWALYGDVAQLRECITRRITEDLSNAFRLMGSFLGQAWSMDTGVPFVPEFRREAYNGVIEYIDPTTLFERLRERFGDSVGTGDFYSFRDKPAEERLANEFAYIHRSVLDEQKATEPADRPA